MTLIPDAPSLDSGMIKIAWHGWRQHDVICGCFGAIMGYLMALNGMSKSDSKNLEMGTE